MEKASKNTLPVNRVEQLIECEKNGDVFHGSPNPKINILQPRQTTDVGQKSGFNVDHAVFASLRPSASVLFACLRLDSFPNDLKGGNWGVGTNDDGVLVARIPSDWKQFLLSNIGYVYVLSGDTFIEESQGGWEVKSTQPVKPKKVIRVCFEDYETLGGIIEWI